MSDGTGDLHSRFTIFLNAAPKRNPAQLFDQRYVVHLRTCRDYNESNAEAVRIYNGDGITRALQ